MAKAKWSAGPPSVNVDPDGTLIASVPIKDGTKLAATVQFTLTADRALRVLCISEPGAAGLSGLEAWSNT